jgi:hypothetical protein
MEPQITGEDQAWLEIERSKKTMRIKILKCEVWGKNQVGEGKEKALGGGPGELGCHCV